MKGILFDMDGVLIDAMHYHAEAFKIAIKEKINPEIDKKNIFILEGMPSFNLVKELFKIEKINDDKSNIKDEENLIKEIGKRKGQIFEEIQKARAFEGVKELLDSLNCRDCLKAVVSGASKQEVESLLDQNGINDFNIKITGEDLEDGKPDPEPFQTALDKLNLKPSEAVIVENAPLGVKSAIRAGVRYIVTLNNTPLDLANFKDVLPNNEKEVNNIVYKDTKSASKFLSDWCCSK